MFLTAYKQGLQTKVDLVPSILEPYHVQLALARKGANDLYRGTNRFYQRGISVGAASRGVVGSVADVLVHLLLDLFHISLILAGGLTLWKVIRG